MARLLFQKTGNAVWISHLDLMRLFQRAFKRAGLPLKHTQGYNPRPSVSIALPLSVGIESYCELLDFELDCEFDQWDSLPERLNAVLIDGITVMQVYGDGKKIRDLALMCSKIVLKYDHSTPVGAEDLIRELFSRNEVSVMKKTKSGMQEQNIIPMIQKIGIYQAGKDCLMLEVLHCCQNPTLNPAQISAAIETYLPDCKPDFCKCYRIEIYDINEVVFR